MRAAMPRLLCRCMGMSDLSVAELVRERGLADLDAIAEWAFGHTTRLTMNERLDFAHPLLRRLMTEAPGTFQHSVNVGVLADAAA